MEKSLKPSVPWFSPLGSLLSGLFAAWGSRRRGHFSRTDYRFAAVTAPREIMEVILGRMAARKAMLASVKIFGRQMAADHGRAEEKLKEITAHQDAVCPDRPTPSQQEEIDRLGQLNGYEFDREYVSLMRRIHAHDLRQFERAAGRVENPELKDFAEGTSFLLRHHLEMEKYLAAQIEQEARYGSGRPPVR